MYSNKILWLSTVVTLPLYNNRIPNTLRIRYNGSQYFKTESKGEIQLIRYADKDKDRTICIRLKENAHQQNVAGKISIIITSEKCTQ